MLHILTQEVYLKKLTPTVLNLTQLIFSKLSICVGGVGQLLLSQKWGIYTQIEDSKIYFSIATFDNPKEGPGFEWLQNGS